MKPDREAANKRIAVLLVATAFGMFGFGYALVPLYNVFCELTGINGKTGQLEAKAASGMTIDAGRWVTVEFTGSVNQGMPWEFRPAMARTRVRPGELATTTYYARNLSRVPMTGQAVPSVSPNGAASYFKKIECFCFSQQELQPNEAKAMPVRYVVAPDLPKDIRTITLSYTFFDTDRSPASRRAGG